MTTIGGYPTPQRRPAPRALWMWRVSGSVQGLIVVAIGVLAIVFGWWPSPWTWLVLTAGILDLLVAVTLVPTWRYRVHRWDIDESAVQTQSGWLTVERRITPVNRVQTVDTERGPAAQLFRLTTVRITTASARGELRIHGLERTTADQLVQQLTLSAAATRNDAT